MSGGFGKQGTSVTALRAQMRAAAANSSPPPPPKKHKSEQLEDIHDKAAEAAERKSLAQHQTSLLSKAPRNLRLKPEEKKRGIPLVFQILFVLLLVGGGALFLDPSLMAYVQPYIDQLEPHIQSLREQVGL